MVVGLNLEWSVSDVIIHKRVIGEVGFIARGIYGYGSNKEWNQRSCMKSTLQRLSEDESCLIISIAISHQ